MDVHQARAFVALAEELHFGRAAERMHMTQPPFSRLIRQIETEIDAPLFERSTRQVVMTKVGRALVEPARKIIAASEDFGRIAGDLKAGRRGKITLAFTGSSFYMGLAELARTVGADMPHVNLELVPAQLSPQGLDGVLSSEFDAAVGRWETLPPRVKSLVIGYEEVLVAVPARHRLAKKASVRMEDVAEEPWIALSGATTGAVQSRFRSLAREAGFTPHVVSEVQDTWTQIALVSAGLGCGFTLDSARDNLRAAGVAFVPLQPRSQLELKLIWKAGAGNPALAPLLEVARRLWARPQ